MVGAIQEQQEEVNLKDFASGSDLSGNTFCWIRRPLWLSSQWQC